MVKHISRFLNPRAITLGLLALSVIVWLVWMHEFRLDDSFITYRYARNLASGLGLVYNQGDSILSTTAPLYAILLALLSFIIRDFHVLGSLIGIISIGLGGALIVQLAARRLPLSLSVWAGVVYVLSSPLWLALGMETPLWIMLVLAAIWLAQLDRWPLSGLLIGLAILTRPDAALPGLLLGLVAIGTTINRANTRRRWWLPAIGYAALAAVPVILFALWGLATYGSPFPVTLSAKSAQAVLGITGLGYNVTYWDGLRLILRSLMVQSPLYIALGLLVIFGMAGKLFAPLWIVVVWAALHLIAYILLGVAPYRWYYAPLVPAVVLLAANGLQYIDTRLAQRKVAIGRYVVVAIALFPILAEVNSFVRIYDQIQNGSRENRPSSTPADVMLPIVDWQAYHDVGEWLDQQTPPDATVGVAEVGQVGFYANRWMTDYLGLLQPDVAAALKRGDLYSWLAGYAPDYLVFQRFGGAVLVLYNYVIQDDPWFTTNYQQVAQFDDARYSSGPVTIFKRVTSERPLTAFAAQLDYGALHLSGVQTDADSLTTEGGAVRVRLDWQVNGGLPPDLHIAVKIVDQKTNPGFDGDYKTANWHGTFSTWHGFVVPDTIAPGKYPLLVAVGPTGGPYQEQGVGEIEIR
jgi:arabinofuranosyltransferase